MSPRRPRTAVTTTSLPTLAIALGGASALQGCHDPVCGSTRSDELNAHGARLDRELRDGRLAEAFRQFTVATGITRHSDLPTTDPDLRPAGAMPVVDPIPPPPQPPPDEMHTGGAVAPVQVAPVPPPPRRHHTRAPGEAPPVRP